MSAKPSLVTLKGVSILWSTRMDHEVGPTMYLEIRSSLCCQYWCSPVAFPIPGLHSKYLVGLNLVVDLDPHLGSGLFL